MKIATIFIRIVALIVLVIPGTGCSLKTNVLVQNRTDETIELMCWDGKPDHTLWSVTIPPNSVVDFELDPSRIATAQDGRQYLLVHEDHGFTVRGQSFQLEKNKLLDQTAQDLSVSLDQCSRRHQRRRYYDIVITEDDIVLLVHADSAKTTLLDPVQVGDAS